MKYYSTELKKYFDDADSCLEAEKAYQEEQEKKKQVREEKNALISKEKKELANAVDDAETALNEAYAEYQDAWNRAHELIEKANKEAADILQPAKDKISLAQKNKYQAISNFNKKYGPYTTSYTGDRALQEFNRMKNWIFDFGNWLF